MNFTDDDLVALFYIQKYGFLTIDQAVQAIDRNRSKQKIGRKLKAMADLGYLGAFGGHRVAFGNAPKVYFIQRKGYDLLLDNGFMPELMGRYKQRNKPGWSNKTNHRIHLIDVFLSLELAVRRLPALELVRVFLEYNRVRSGKTVVSETTDYVGEAQGEEHRIIPDGAFILRSRKTGALELFLVEMDMGTEGVVNRVGLHPEQRVMFRMKQYDQYLLGGNYKRKYADFGEFSHFRLLFICKQQNRVENIRQKLTELPVKYEKLHEYYLFNYFGLVVESFFNESWKIRAVEDQGNYSLLG